MRKLALSLVIVVFAVFSNTKVQSFDTLSATQGRLDAFTKKGKPLGNSPLKHTKVKADISGFLARVTVQQEFTNNFNQPIEAVYIFPLSENSAVDDMTMKIGSRTIRGKIKKKEEARKIYEVAKSQGKTASLLDQERPNVFTQSVANILPNEKIVIEISYVENLRYEDGSYEFVFPMVVGTRYSPKSVKAENAAKVTPPVASKNRAGHDISIEVNLDAGVPIENISSKLHQINSQNFSSNSAKITLRNEKTIPNKDFILKYDVTGKRIQDAILTHRTAKGGFFTMMLSPPENFSIEDVSPKEIVFVLDTSGSMSGFPIEKAKEAMKMSLEGLYPNDTFNLITFAGNTSILFDEPVLATQANLEKANKFLETRRGYGGTEMMKAIKAALKPSNSQEHIRIVNFMTDGYVSNESEIISEIQKHPNARVFSFGIGNSINRFLLSKMAEEGRGEATFVTLEDDGSKAAKKFHERIRNPLLTDISIDWNGMPVADVYPKRNPDLFDAKPVVINGRFTKSTNGTIKLKGKVGGQHYEREIKVNFPEREEKHDVLATLWARKRIDDLTSKNYDYGSEEANPDSEAIKLITQIGLEFRLLTEFTSFVAVEEVVRTQGGKPVKIEVPVELANGTFGTNEDSGGGAGGGGVQKDSPFRRLEIRTRLQRPPKAKYKNSKRRIISGGVTGTRSGSGFGTGEGSGSGSGSGSGNGSARKPPPPLKLAGTPLPATKSVPKRISAGVINGKGSGLEINNPPPKPKPKGPTTGIKILSKPRPAVSEAARQSNIRGIIRLRVTFLVSGKIGRVSVVKGLPNGLTEKAIEATRKIRFKPPMRNGVPYSVNKVVQYNYRNGFLNGTESLSGDSKIPIDDKELSKENNLKQKLHFWVYDLVERLQNGKTKSTVNEDKFVKGGKAKLQIQLSKKSAEAIDNLKDLGFEISKDDCKDILIGEIAVEKIADLVEIEQVKYILPKVR